MGIPALDLALVFFAGNYNQAVTHLVKKRHIPDFILRSVKQGDPPQDRPDLPPW